ncbi:DNA repair protein RecO [Legionella dresdenensis]|uniref:DNA repair protein RecO n=1 Tax=Legionella dresdenensis TaxID=450200 RepID=A0ABV8CDQ8_9GAMM
MTIESFNAWLIHKQPSGDTSTRLTFFTAEKGIVTCDYKGGRTPKKQAASQLFTSLWVAVTSRNNWHYIQSLESPAQPINLQGISLFSALYLNELIYYTLKPQDAQPELFEAYQFTMHALETVEERLAIEVLLRQFEWLLLKNCGYQFAEETINSEPLSADNRYVYIPGKGFIGAENGLPGGDILAVVAGQFHEAAVLRTAKIMMRQAIDYLLDGRVLKSRSLFSRLGRHP